MTKNVAVHCPNPNDATSLYRGVGPLSVLRRTMPDLRLAMLPNKVTWASLAMVDVLFMQRPFRPEDLQLARMAKDLGIKIWADFDDDLFTVPSWNPTSETYNTRRIQECIAECAVLADVISLSTSNLKNTFGQFNQNLVLVPNAWNDSFYPRNLQERGITNGEFLVLWRGSQTHRKDLNIAADACIEAAKTHPMITWAFIGDAPWFADYMPNHSVKILPAVDPFEYHKIIAKVRPNLWIVPLDDCDFNRSKSNCAWIEASWAGAATLAPAWPEWAMPGICHYNGVRDFGLKLRHLIAQSVASLDAQADKSWQYISENLRLSAINARRQAILEGLTHDR